jgi:pimeloyl-ACP methyl ester carboxylesterase
MDSLRIPVGAGSLNVERAGFGDRAVVLLHGFGTSAFVWRHVTPLLPLGRVTTFAVDMLGWGESDRVPEADHGVRAQSEYLERALTVLRVARADLVALDFSSVVALALAVRRPARVRTLVLLNPCHPEHPRGADFAEFDRLAARHVLDASLSMTGAVLVLGPILERSVASPERMSRVLVARYAAPFVGRDGFLHLNKVQGSVNDRALSHVAWRSVSAPVLIVRGDADGWVSADASTSLASALPGSRLLRKQAVARLIPEDDPAWLADVLARWTTDDAASVTSVGDDSSSR